MSKRIKNIYKYVFNKFCSIIGASRCFAFLEQLVTALQNSTKTFITYHQRPQQATSILTLSQLEPQLPQLAIVIQGPIISANDFTAETVKLYKQHFPKALIILSTWRDEQKVVVTMFENLGINMLLNDKPDYAGISNINMQIVSTKAGIKKANELGAEYVIKTRTDQRMYAPNVEQFLFDIIRVFPLKAGIKIQRKRIVGLSLNTFKYRMYGLSDMFIYGHIDDMLLFWDIPLDTRIFNAKEIETAGASLKSFAQWRVCEVFLETEFLMKVGRKLKCTLEDSWSAFADHFCVVDHESLDLYWGKYRSQENRWLDYYKPINKFEELNFKDWLNLYCNLNQINIDEKILDL